MATNSNIALLPVAGDIDVQSVGQLRASLDGLIAAGYRRIILNMADVHYMDSAGMALILVEVRRMRQLGGLMSLTNVRPRVMHALKVSRLVDYIPASQMGRRPQVEELAPSARPQWRTTLSVQPGKLSEARSRVEALLRRMPLSSDQVFDTTLAVGEALGNAVDHTEGDGILTTVTAYPDRAVVEVTDCGEGYELGPDEEPISCTGLAERGRGIKLMRLLVDTVSIGVKPSGTGTVVRLVKLTNQ